MDGFNQLRGERHDDPEAAVRSRDWERGRRQLQEDGDPPEVSDPGPVPINNREVVRSISASASLGDMRNPAQVNISASWRSIESRSPAVPARTDVTRPTPPRTTPSTSSRATTSTSTSPQRAASTPDVSTVSRATKSTSTSPQPATSSPDVSTVYMSLSTVVSSSGTLEAFQDLPLHEETETEVGSSVTLAQPLAASFPAFDAAVPTPAVDFVGPLALVLHLADRHADADGHLVATPQPHARPTTPDVAKLTVEVEVHPEPGDTSDRVVAPPQVLSEPAPELAELPGAQLQPAQSPAALDEPQDGQPPSVLDEAQDGQPPSTLEKAEDGQPPAMQPPAVLPSQAAQPPSVVPLQVPLTEALVQPQAGAQALVESQADPQALVEPQAAQPLVQTQAAAQPLVQTQAAAQPLVQPQPVRAGPSNVQMQDQEDHDDVPSPPKRSRKAKSKRFRKRKSPYVESEEDPSSADEEQEFPTRFSPRNKRGYRF